jgi:hypothetical protein
VRQGSVCHCWASLHGIVPESDLLTTQVQDLHVSCGPACLPAGTKALGATAGVMVGCLLGLSPLFISGTFFTDR